jgi:hypothetical protein
MRDIYSPLVCPCGNPTLCWNPCDREREDSPASATVVYSGSTTARRLYNDGILSVPGYVFCRARRVKLVTKERREELAQARVLKYDLQHARGAPRYISPRIS